MKKIFFTGGSGLLSVNLATLLNKNFNIVLNLHKKRIKIKNTKNIKIDLLNNTMLKSFCLRTKPDIIVHTAAISDIEYCETYKKKCRLVNFEITKNISKVCKLFNIKLIFISTDHLFSGVKMFYKESSKCNPLNYYAKSKLMSENLIKKNLKNYLILRTNFYGVGPKYRNSFSDWIINSLKNDKNIFMFKDVFFTPILINDFSDILKNLINKNIKGIFNVSGKERISKYKFAVKLAKIFKFRSNLIKEISIKEVKLTRRPLDMSLDITKLKKTILIKPKSINQSLRYLKKIINSSYYKKIKSI